MLLDENQYECNQRWEGLDKKNAEIHTPGSVHSCYDDTDEKVDLEGMSQREV